MPDPITSLTPAPIIGVTEPTAINFGHHAPSFDVIERLPPAAADRLRMLRQRRADQHAVIPAFEQVREASMARIEAANALKRLTDHPQDGGFNLKPDTRQVIEAQRTLDKATGDHERLKQLQEVRTATWREASQAVAGCENFLRQGVPGNCTLDTVEGEPPKLNKGEGVLDGIERVRRRGRELKADLHRIESAPFPSSYAKQQMRAEIEALAQRGAPSVTNLIEHDGKIIWPTLRVQVVILNAQPGAVGFVEIPDMLAIDAWRNKDASLARLDAEVASEADDKAALTHEARKKAEAEVMLDLLAVERDEAALVWRAMDKKLPVEHRADCSPLAILQVALVTTAAPNGSGSSWMHAYDIRGGR